MLLNRPTQKQVTEYITNSAKNKYDKIVSKDRLAASVLIHNNKQQNAVKYTSVCKLMGKADVSFSKSALGQLLNRMKVPTKFYNKCPSTLKVPIFTYFNEQHEGSYLFRMEKNANSIDSVSEKCRAVFSSKYGVINDSQIFQNVFNVLGKENKQFLCKIFENDDHITRLVVEFPDTKITHLGVPYVAGLSVVNSETGYSSVWIEPMVHTPTVSFVNRKALKTQGINCRIVHRGEVNSIKIKSMVEQCKEISQVGLVQFIENREKSISSDVALKYAKSIDSLPKRLYDILTDEWKDIQNLKREEAARRIIQLAKELPLFKRINVEQETGKIVGLFNKYHSRMNAIIEEIENN